MTYPILEFDATPEAFIEPSRVICARDLPEHCVICFFREVIDKIVAEHDAKVAVENRWEDGLHRIYEITHRNQRLAFFHPGVGAPIAASGAFSFSSDTNSASAGCVADSERRITSRPSCPH